uniref:Uncharacterized protein n=1 Tax=Parascaris univalens TaxID=6257 RepID=A0A915BPT3_PARUN
MCKLFISNSSSFRKFFFYFCGSLRVETRPISFQKKTSSGATLAVISLSRMIKWSCQ